MKNPDVVSITLADIQREGRNRLADRAVEQIGQLADLVAGKPEANYLIGSLRGLVELLRDANSDDFHIDLRGLANRLDLHAVELVELENYEGAKTAIECAEALIRRQCQIDASAFREPEVDRGSLG